MSDEQPEDPYSASPTMNADADTVASLQRIAAAANAANPVNPERTNELYACFVDPIPKVGEDTVEIQMLFINRSDVPIPQFGLVSPFRVTGTNKESGEITHSFAWVDGRCESRQITLASREVVAWPCTLRVPERPAGSAPVFEELDGITYEVIRDPDGQQQYGLSPSREALLDAWNTPLEASPTAWRAQYRYFGEP